MSTDTDRHQVPVPTTPQPGPGSDGVPFPRSATDLDMARLTEITAEHGFAVFDPSTTGGFRELTDDERLVLDRETARERGPASVQGPIFDEIDLVEARGQDPGFPYVPAAEFSDAAYREPRSDAEAAARTAWLEHQHNLEHGPTEPAPAPVEIDELEQALVDAEIDAHYSALAHDDDPAPAQRVRELQAQLDGRELELGAELDEQDRDEPQRGAPEQDPGIALEDAWFRTSLQDVVPADTPDRDAVIERAVDHARDRFVEHGEITYPEQALAASTNQPEPAPTATEPEPDGPEPDGPEPDGPEVQFEDEEVEP